MKEDTRYVWNSNRHTRHFCLNSETHFQKVERGGEVNEGKCGKINFKQPLPSVHSTDMYEDYNIFC